MTHAVSAAEYAHTEGSNYADPGYQPDKKKRYPLDSEAHCRAAWSYINQADNAGKYSPEELKRIKARIVAAGKRYGITFAKDVSAAAELRDIELARPGTWHLQSGPITVTPRHLDDAARFANREGARPPYIKIGHTDSRFVAADGEPAMGWVSNVRVEEDDQGHVLKGDITGMPEWLAEAAPRHWPDRSMEGWEDYTDEDGEKYSLIMHGLALLGVTAPGMASIKSLRDLPAALGLPVSASGRPIIASFGGPQTPAPEAGPPPTSKGAGMPADPTEIREALGLGPDASDDEVRDAFAEAFPAPAGTPVTASALPPGMMVIASSVWDETQKSIKTLNDFVAKTKRNEKDDFIAQAIKDGKLTPADKQTMSEQWDLHPDLTRAWIERIRPNSALAVMASGYAGDVGGEPDELDREIERLSPPKGKVA